jgi:cytochrome c
VKKSVFGEWVESRPRDIADEPPRRATELLPIKTRCALIARPASPIWRVKRRNVMSAGWINRLSAVGIAAAALTFGSGAWAQDLTGDPAKGADVFKRCIACHKVGPSAKNGVGPNLNGVVGRPAATEAGYSYSDALKASGITWDKATLQQWVQGPKKLVPGTKMTFAGLASAQDAADVVAYLATFDKDGNKVTQ